MRHGSEPLAASLPHRHDGLAVAEFDTEWVVYDERCRQVHRITGLAAVVFDACDGHTDRRSLVEDVSAALDTPYETAVDLVDHALGELRQVRLVTGSPHDDAPPCVGTPDAAAPRRTPHRLARLLRRAPVAEPLTTDLAPSP